MYWFLICYLRQNLKTKNCPIGIKKKKTRPSGVDLNENGTVRRSFFKLSGENRELSQNFFTQKEYDAYLSHIFE